MKFTNLKINNFMALGSSDLDLSDRGLVLIQGINHDDASAISNGAGKSSIPDALSWCFFGTTAREETGDKIINNKAKSASVSTTVLMDSGETYVISRYRKDKENKNRLTITKSPDVDLTLGTDKQTQERVNSILGCDHKVFNAAIYQGQEKIPDLPKYTDKQLKELVEEAAGISVVQDCYKLSSKKRLDAQSILDKAISDKENAAAAYEKAKSDIEVVLERSAEWKRDHKGLIATKKEVAKDAKDAYDLAKERLDKAEEKREAIEGNITKFRLALKGKEDLDAEYAAMGVEVSNQASNVRVAESNVKREHATLSSLNAKLKNVADKIGTGCTSCGKTIKEKDLASVSNQIKDDITEATERHIEALGHVEFTKRDHRQYLEKAEKFKAEMPDYSEVTEKLMKCREVITKINAMASNVDLRKSAHESAASSLAEKKAEKNPHDSVHESLDKGRLGAIDKLAKATKRAEVAAERKEEMDQVVEVFSPAGVRAHILDHVTPFLNARTGHYLSTLSDGNLQAKWTTLSKTAKGELREKFTIEVTNATGGKSFGLQSGGEKRKVRLSCAMALQDIVSQRATKPIDLFMADEIDDALDDAGLERLMAILDEKARERGTVLVVSHNSLSDWIREVSTVEKKGGVSKISGALCA